MMLTPAEKALELCREYALLSRRVSDLTTRIAEALALCPVYLDATDDTPTNDKGFYRTHITEAFEWLVYPGPEGAIPFRYRRSDSEIRRLLNACPACATAYRQIKSRKAARLRLGIVKRSIRALGKMKD
jgi:hypothetical protein